MMQIQPQRADLPVYLKFAEKHCLQFEITDFAFSRVSESDTKAAYENILIPSMHGAFMDLNYASNDPLIREASRNRVIDSVKSGVALGVKNIVLHTCF